MNRSCTARLSAVALVFVALASAAQVSAQPLCTPALTIARTHLSEIRKPASERTWTAAVAVDASRCASPASGTFDLVVSRLKENAPEARFRERFVWRAPAVAVELAFSADEAVERSWIEAVTPCPCAP
jgi:curli biogenesis system outer membrane secretion channel CsgG